jgi:hypothetical protein
MLCFQSFAFFIWDRNYPVSTLDKGHCFGMLGSLNDNLYFQRRCVAAPWNRSSIEHVPRLDFVQPEE